METANAHVTVCDINKAMLDVGQQRATRFNYSSGAHTGYLNVFSFECLQVQKEYNNYVLHAVKINYELKVICLQHNYYYVPLTEN